jgi:hypothetical protein
MLRGDGRIWTTRILVLAGVSACWVSSGAGFVLGGLMIATAGLLALLHPSGSLSRRRAFQVPANAGLMLVGVALVITGLS